MGKDNTIIKGDYISTATHPAIPLVKKSKVWGTALPRVMPNRHGAHFDHCYQGEYLNTCKYGDLDCPVQPLESQMVPKDVVQTVLKDIEAHFMDKRFTTHRHEISKKYFNKLKRKYGLT